MRAGILPQKDGVMVINHIGAMGKKVASTSFLRILHTDSGHYLLPIDDPAANTGEEAELLKRAVKGYVEFIMDTGSPSKPNARTALLATPTELPSDLSKQSDGNVGSCEISTQTRSEVRVLNSSTSESRMRLKE